MSVGVQQESISYLHARHYQHQLGRGLHGCCLHPAAGRGRRFHAMPCARYRRHNSRDSEPRLSTAHHFFSISTFFSASTWSGIFLPSIPFGRGMLTSTIPFLKVAWILSAAAPSGRLIRRSNDP